MLMYITRPPMLFEILDCTASAERQKKCSVGADESPIGETVQHSAHPDILRAIFMPFYTAFGVFRGNAT